MVTVTVDGFVGNDHSLSIMDSFIHSFIQSCRRTDPPLKKKGKEGKGSMYRLIEASFCDYKAIYSIE